MSIAFVITSFSAMLLTALLVKPLSEKYALPFAAVLVLTGFVGSELLVFFSIDTGLRHQSFQDIILYILLPVLIFESAFKMDATLMMRNLFLILMYAIPVVMLSIFVSAALIYYGIGHASGFPWIAALMTGAILSATDPVPIIASLRRFKVAKRLRVILEGESLFSDATAIVSFSIFVYIALHPMEDISTADIMVRYIVVFFGGMMVGLLVGLSFLTLSRLFEDHVQQGVVTLISAYVSYLLAEFYLNVSGVISVLVTGLIMGRVIHNDFQDYRGSFVDEFWTFNVRICEAVMYLLMGISVGIAMFTDRWLAMLIGIAAVLLARSVGIFATAPVLNRLPFVEPLEPGQHQLMFLGGLRGAVALALAFSLPTELDYWWTIQSIVFGVVIFSLFIQAPLVDRVIKRQASTDSDK